MRGRRGRAATALGGILLASLILALAPAAQAEPVGSPSPCPEAERQRVLADLAEAEAASARAGTIGAEKPRLAEARQLLQRCSKATLAFGEIAAASAQLQTGDPAAMASAARLLEAGCRMAEQAGEQEDGRTVEFNCKSGLLDVLAELGRYDEAERVALDLHTLAERNGFDTSGIVSGLVEEQIEAVKNNDLAKARAYVRLRNIVATGRVAEAASMAELAEAARTDLFLGQFGAALKNAREAHRLLEQQPDAKRSAEALFVLLLRGTAHLELGQPAQALKVFAEGKALAPAIFAAARGRPSDLAAAGFIAATLYKKTAVAALLTSHPADAQSAIADAWAAARDSKLDGLGDSLGLPRLQAQAVIDEGGGSDEAIRAARQIVTEGDDPAGSAILNLTKNLTSSVGPAEVDALLRSAPALLAAAPRDDRVEIHVRLARAFERAGDEDAAIQHYASAVELIEDGRLQSRDSEAIPFFFSRYIDIYHRLVAALFDRAKAGGRPPDPALRRFGSSDAEIGLHFAEAAHARQFADLYGRSLMDRYAALAGLPASVAAQERRLRAALGQAVEFGSLGALTILQSPVAVRQQSDAAAQAYADFIDAARRRYPRYASLAFPQPVTLAELPASLNGKYIVSYMVADDAVYWWLVFDREIVAFGHAEIARGTLRKLVRSFVGAVNDEAPALCTALVRGPFDKIAAIAPASAVPEVIVVPDDVLYTMPWEALCGLQGGSLGENFIISYAPSLTVLAQSARVTAPQQLRTAFVLGNTQESPTTIPGLGAYGKLRKDLFDGPVSVLKSEGYKPVTLEGPGATPEAVLARDLTPYALVHFDTHGFAGQLEPPPSLLLHPSPESPFGLLSLADIAKLRLRARLVTLSACETALGAEAEPLPGEGVEALARAFMLAGAKSVLATLWNVQDEPAAALVENFYRQLKPGGAPDLATALFLAKAAVRQKYKYRQYWTGFILIGDPGP